MSINSTVTPYPKLAATYPSLWEHVPTGCIILFVNANDGWLVGDPARNATKPVGAKWSNCNPVNYKPFYGTVMLGNV